MRDTGVAQQHGETVFLCDPHWSAAQLEQFRGIIRKADAAGRRAPTAHANKTKPQLRVAIPTGGSSGGLKFALHDERTLGAAVRGFCEHFGVVRVNAVDCLPPWHVSGLMSRLRCAATGGVHLPWEWKRLEAGDFPELPASSGARGGSASLVGGCFLSLVPTQLQRLLKLGERGRDWLRGFDAVFVGGGPLWPSLADEAATGAKARTAVGTTAQSATAGLPIVLSYGMTETGAMVAAQRIGDFAGGDRSSGVPMPHAQLSINEEGLVCVRGESVALSASSFASCCETHGHALAARQETCDGGATREFTTADLGRIDEAGRLHILGRRDEVAISGGEKVRLAEVEAALREWKCSSGTAVFDDVAVVAVPDAEWGEAVVACYLSEGTVSIPEAMLSKKATLHLARHQRPKQWLAFAPDEWPRNAQGKLNRAALRDAVLARRTGVPPR